VRAIVLKEFGEASVLHVDDLSEPTAGASDVVVDVVAAGVNYLDILQRRGAGNLPLPRIAGMEGAGTVVSVGSDVTDVQVGARVCWAMVPQAGYAERVVVPADRCIPVPENVDLRVAGAAIMQGLTAQMLVETTYPVKKGDAVLVLPAAGGVGSLVTQLAVAKGARVYALASTASKREYVETLGAVQVYPSDDIESAVADVKSRTDGGVHAVFDGVGRTTFTTTLTALRRFGTFVLFGAASGPAPLIDPQSLSQAGSVYLTRPGLAQHIASTTELRTRGARVFELLTSGGFNVRIDRDLPLAGASEAHRLLEGRSSHGKLVIDPRA
jgi:NADPH2:quinone reductase